MVRFVLPLCAYVALQLFWFERLRRGFNNSMYAVSSSFTNVFFFVIAIISIMTAVCSFLVAQTTKCNQPIQIIDFNPFGTLESESKLYDCGGWPLWLQIVMAVGLFAGLLTALVSTWLGVAYLYRLILVTSSTIESNEDHVIEFGILRMVRSSVVALASVLSIVVSSVLYAAYFPAHAIVNVNIVLNCLLMLCAFDFGQHIYNLIFAYTCCKKCFEVPIENAIITQVETQVRTSVHSRSPMPSLMGMRSVTPRPSVAPIHRDLRLQLAISRTRSQSSMQLPIKQLHLQAENQHVKSVSSLTMGNHPHEGLHRGNLLRNSSEDLTPRPSIVEMKSSSQLTSAFDEPDELPDDDLIISTNLSLQEMDTKAISLPHIIEHEDKDKDKTKGSGKDKNKDTDRDRDLLTTPIPDSDHKTPELSSQFELTPKKK
ncbi:hypothetical protein RFI_30822 [Reticulomyxa filosa]|uniref:Transmembrane protein n=1 Tax=Reticulomyxa filosa TaxID=46433 RepID=X6LZJ4_RETFI|nr:hypothetical protein RFI_30822 [Reticulomyxa filosa]|eukprot:ETO06572.1 hypothetical protein RFI_30822 [Reticulomyxa filosa]